MGCICIQVLHTRVNSHNQMIFHMVCTKKTTRVVRKNFEYTCFQCLILSFLHRAHRMSFYSKNLYGCEELVYICIPFFSEFFKKFYYFLNFTKSEGVGEVGLTYEFPAQHVVVKQRKGQWRLN